MPSISFLFSILSSLIANHSHFFAQLALRSYLIVLTALTLLVLVVCITVISRAKFASFFLILFIVFAIVSLILYILMFIGSNFHRQEQRLCYYFLNLSHIGIILLILLLSFVFLTSMTASSLTQSFLSSKVEDTLLNIEPAPTKLRSILRPFFDFMLTPSGFGSLSAIVIVLFTLTTIPIAIILEKQLYYFVCLHLTFIYHLYSGHIRLPRSVYRPLWSYSHFF